MVFIIIALMLTHSKHKYIIMNIIFQGTTTTWNALFVSERITLFIMNDKTIIILSWVTKFCCIHRLKCGRCSKVQQYLPTESAKVLNKQISRRSTVKFNPKQVLELVQSSSTLPHHPEQEKLLIVSNCIEVTNEILVVLECMSTVLSCETESTDQ